VIESARTRYALVRLILRSPWGEGQSIMSQISNGILAALAVSATLGAAQLASGHDLMGRLQVAATTPEDGVNRAAKANRDVSKVAAGQERTIALRFKELADTSVLVRVPVAREEARNRPVAPVAPLKSRKLRNAVACEPPVSVLTEVAKLLEPGRCVT
jgi:hypothetical protein